MTESKLRQALDDLALRVESYRKAHDLFGDADLVTGRCWDLMRRSEKRARAALEEPVEEDEPEPINLLRAIKRQLESSESLDVDTWQWIGRVLHYFDKNQGLGPVGSGGGPAPSISVGADDGRQKTGSLTSAPAPATELKQRPSPGSLE